MLMMKEKYPEIPVCCTPLTCGKLILGVLFLPFLRIVEDCFCVPFYNPVFAKMKVREAWRTGKPSVILQMQI